MKILTITFIIFLAFTRAAISQNAHDSFDAFLKYFKSTSLPIDTRNYMERKRGDNMILPDDLNLRYICGNDSNKLFYFLELTSDDSQEITFSGNRKYLVGASEFFRINDLIFITYQRKRQDEGKMYYLAIYQNVGIFKDSLLVLGTNPEGEFYDWICSKISEQKVLIFHYKYDFTSKITTINLLTYKIDSKAGEFILINNEVLESNCSIEDFYNRKENCIASDPFNNYN